MRDEPGEFTDERFMSARDKRQVLKAWITFLKHGCQLAHFTERLYSHLIQHCSFIAHYDRHGFYAHYFDEGEQAIRFLSQFDARGSMRSIEYGFIGAGWMTGGTGEDLNRAMVREAAAFIPALTASFAGAQRVSDLARARALLMKHGVSPEMLALLSEGEGRAEPSQLSLLDAA
jgi:hypothetical protein